MDNTPNIAEDGGGR